MVNQCYVANATTARWVKEQRGATVWIIIGKQTMEEYLGNLVKMYRLWNTEMCRPVNVYRKNKENQLVNKVC